ncbi:MAG TPA: Veg protein [Firmicutes bacterium]|jgi:uncharacterized protein Veg|nr:Veg protein [Bacillota bacterium]
MTNNNQVLADIRKNLDSLVGARIRVRANKGRKRIVEREGVLEKTYSNHFTVKLDEKQSQRVISYTYADILTEAVELTPCCPSERKITGIRKAT